MNEPYKIKLHYDFIGRDTQSYSYPSWIKAKEAFDRWAVDRAHATEIKKVELIVRGAIEEYAPAERKAS